MKQEMHEARNVGFSVLGGKMGTNFRSARYAYRSFWALVTVFFLLGGTPAFAQTKFDQWLEQQAQISRYKLLKNISHEGVTKGAVIASPSTVAPNYFFHWIRDAALVMDVVAGLYQSATTNEEKAYYHEVLVNYIRFSRRNQLITTMTGLGEPKFNVDGSAYNGDWGRPQYDGAALRAIVLTKLAALWLKEGKEQLVRQLLYNGDFPPTSVIKADLEFVGQSWGCQGFDIWEEISGKHFYTSMVQRKALLYGAKLAAALGDSGAAGFYLEQARRMEAEIHRHWNGRILVSTIDQKEGIKHKFSGLDSSVILGAVHGYAGDGFYSFTNDRLQSTFFQIQDVFRRIYPINQKKFPAVAIGRYPEDRYDGNGYTGGNPWVLLTLGFGEFLHRTSEEYRSKGAIEITEHSSDFFRSLGLNVSAPSYISRDDSLFETVVQKLSSTGDAYVSRIAFHANSDGSFSEQIDRYSGTMRGAFDLTWSYASFLTVYWSRAR